MALSADTPIAIHVRPFLFLFLGHVVPPVCLDVLGWGFVQMS